MKKFLNFLKKKVVLIVLSVVSLVLVGTYIGLLARPISYGMNYSLTTKENNEKKTGTYNFKRDGTVVLYEKLVDKDGKVTTDTETIKYEVKGNKIIIAGVEMFTISAFKVTMRINNPIGADTVYTYTNGGTIAIAVIGGILVAMSLSANILSIILYVKKPTKTTKAKTKKRA